ncbi:Meiotically up-regulated protein [Apiospora marii]|uniref:Meiotically up-regulated protein n=1 Tax=Apiospora marii TaxID=335849 RepID=A0ABR1RGR6_9PEZI
MFRYSLSLALVVGALRGALAQCPEYVSYSTQKHAPASSGKHALSYMRPTPACRTYALSEVDQTIQDMKSAVTDPDLFRLFENTFPNTLDTTISWKGFARDDSDEELTFIVTGDITAMWLRDSANQLRSYKSLLNANSSTDSLASLYRGAINLQSRYILTSPYCNAFQAPVESGLAPEDNGAAKTDQVVPPYDAASVFECKYELDSLSAFLQLSSDYFEKTQDLAFFGKYQWVQAIRTLVNVTESLRVGTYADDGRVNASPYKFQRTTTRASETLMNDGAGSPVQGGTGLVRSAFRPSDDSTIYQLFIPANMMFSSYLARCADIMAKLDGTLASQMSDMAASVRAGIEKHGKTSLDDFGDVYAFEVDGFGSVNMMDDANVPSLLSAPIIDYINSSDTTYQNTRRFALSKSDPYFMHGPVISGVGGPHQGPGKAWPMSVIVTLLSSDDDDEIVQGLRTLVSSTDGLGLIHESINTFDAHDYTRQWFSWANGLFGELLLGLKDRKPELLKKSFQ